MTGDDDLVALHEAAHGVVAQMSGMDVRAITLHRADARQDERGRCELVDYGAERDADPTRFLIFLLAGASAEKRACGKHTSRDADDRHMAALFASAAVLNEAPDSPRVRTMLQDVQLIADARIADETTWDWIERVAAQLVRRRRLTGRDVHELRPVTP